MIHETVEATALIILKRQVTNQNNHGMRNTHKCSVSSAKDPKKGLSKSVMTTNAPYPNTTDTTHRPINGYMMSPPNRFLMIASVARRSPAPITKPMMKGALRIPTATALGSQQVNTSSWRLQGHALQKMVDASSFCEYKNGQARLSQDSFILQQSGSWTPSGQYEGVHISDDVASE